MIIIFYPNCIISYDYAIKQLSRRLNESCLVNKRNHTSHLKIKCFCHSDKLVNVRAIYHLVLPCSNSSFWGIKQVISSSSICINGSLSIYTYFSSPYK